MQRQILQATHWEEGQQTHTPEEACTEPLWEPNGEGPKGSSHATVGLDLVTALMKISHALLLKGNYC